MRILFLSSFFCLPPAAGYSIRNLALLKALAAKHEVTYLAFAGDERQREHAAEVHKLCAKAHVVFRKPRYPWGRLLKGLFVKTPFTILNFYHPEMAHWAAEEQQRGAYDLIHAEEIFVAQYVQFDPRRATVLNTHNVNSVLMGRYAQTQANPLKRLYAQITYRKLHRYESELYSKFDRVLVVSREDKKAARAMAPLGTTTKLA